MMSMSGKTGANSQMPTPEEIRRLLERILSSKQFANAPKKQKLLQLICETYLAGRADELNEYLIGYEVFNRNESYNPALDPIVRVGAHELRKKLESYYRGEGKNDEIIIEIPLGSYIPIFTRRLPPPETIEAAKTVRPAPVSTKQSWNIRQSLIGAAFALLIITIVLLVYSNRRLREQTKAGVQQKEL